MSVFTAWLLEGIQDIRSKSTPRITWFAWWIWCGWAWQSPLFYSDDKFDVYKGDESHQKAHLKPQVNQAEWNSLIRMMFYCHKLYQRSIDLKFNKGKWQGKTRKAYEREEKLCTT